MNDDYYNAQLYNIENRLKNLEVKLMSKLDDILDKTNLIDKRQEVIDLKLQLMSLPKLKCEDKKDE